MTHLEESTTDLLSKLSNIKTSEELDKYFENHAQENHSFQEYYNKLLFVKKIALAEAVSSSAIEPHYAYQIINGTKKNPGRDKIISLGLGAHMNIKEIRRALEITSNGILYAKNMRDAIIIKNINNENWDISSINEELWKYKLDTL